MEVQEAQNEGRCKSGLGFLIEFLPILLQFKALREESVDQFEGSVNEKSIATPDNLYQHCLHGRAMRRTNKTMLKWSVYLGPQHPKWTLFPCTWGWHVKCFNGRESLASIFRKVVT